MPRTKKPYRVGTEKWFFENPERAQETIKQILGYLEEFGLKSTEFDSMDAVNIIAGKSDGWERLIALIGWSNTRRKLGIKAVAE